MNALASRTAALSLRSILTVLALAGVGCGGSPTPPVRESPVLTELAEPLFDPAEVLYLDDRDPNPVWTAPDGFNVGFFRPGGSAATNVPGRRDTEPAAIREMDDDGTLWACYDDGIARFVGSSWGSVIQWANIFGADIPADVGCEGLDGREGAEPWFALASQVTLPGEDPGWPVCHFESDSDPTGWQCRLFETPLKRFTRTDEFSFFIEESETDGDLLRSVRTTAPGARVMRVLVDGINAIEAIKPAPGADQILVLPEASTGERPRLVNTEGFIRRVPEDIEGLVATVANGADDLYLVTVDDSFKERCMGEDCVNEYDWTQVVVLRLMGGEISEAAHIDFLEEGGFTSYDALLADETLHVRVDDRWFRLP
ncbi:MAG: hypothetical protein ACFCGT_19635 [Sandaracinaceae bacterium]